MKSHIRHLPASTIVVAWLLMGVLPWASHGADLLKADTSADAQGFVPIFNGKDLTGWDGDPRLWSVRDGTIRGESTAANPARQNTFLIWRAGQLRDFVLKLNFRIRDGNAGIQYRSRDLGNWSVSGYQSEVANDRPNPGIGSGFLYHERGRGELAYVGEFGVIDSAGQRTVVGKVGDARVLKEAGYYRNNDWNECIIRAQGNRLIHWINGYQTIELIDNDPKGGAREGILALQLHAGPPMLVEYKDIRLQTLDAGRHPESASSMTTAKPVGSARPTPISSQACPSNTNEGARSTTSSRDRSERN